MAVMTLVLAILALILSVVALVFVIKIYQAIQLCHVLVRAVNVQLAKVIDTTRNLDFTFNKILDIVHKKKGTTRKIPQSTLEVTTPSETANQESQ